jgi:hypothetical protein
VNANRKLSKLSGREFSFLCLLHVAWLCGLSLTRSPEQVIGTETSKSPIGTLGVHLAGRRAEVTIRQPTMPVPRLEEGGRGVGVGVAEAEAAEVEARLRSKNPNRRRGLGTSGTRKSFPTSLETPRSLQPRLNGRPRRPSKVVEVDCGSETQVA